MARAAGFLMAVSPAAIFFGRIVIPDTPMVFFTVLALIGYAEFSRGGSIRWLIVGSASLTLACLLKLPAVFVGPAVVALLVQHRGWRVFRDPRIWLAGIIPLALTAAWYWRAHLVFERTGLTMGILGAPTKMYPAYVSPGPWPNFYSKWSTAALLSDSAFYERMFVRFYHVLLLPFGLAGAVLGGFFWKGEGRRAMVAWLISLTIFFFIAGEVHRVHESYQLPFVVVAAVFFGGAAWPLFDDAWLRGHLGGGVLRIGRYRDRDCATCAGRDLLQQRDPDVFCAARHGGADATGRPRDRRRHRRQHRDGRRRRLRDHVADPPVLRSPQGLELRADGRVAGGHRQSAAAWGALLRHDPLGRIEERQAGGGRVPRAVSGRRD